MPDTGARWAARNAVAVKESLETRGRVQCEVRLSPGGYWSTCAETLPIGNGQNDDDEGYGPTLPFHKDERRIPNNAFFVTFDESAARLLISARQAAAENFETCCACVAPQRD